MDTGDDLQRLIGALFMVGFDGTSLNVEIRDIIQKYRVGAVLLTSKNFTSASQALELILELQQCAFSSSHEQPLLIAIDQENGGINSLVDEAMSQFPSAMGCAASSSPYLIERIAAATGHELGCLGINWILGPILDVLSSVRPQPLGVRAFGDDPELVARCGLEAMRGYRQAGLGTCGKHFPCYGDLDFLDEAPLSMPSVSLTKAQLRRGPLVPFRTAIQDGLDAVLVGGCAMTGFGRSVSHACLSEEIVTQLLRQELSFEGVVLSECLLMEASYENIGVAQGTVMAVTAGCDMTLVCQSYQAQLEAFSGLKMGIANGLVSVEDIHSSVRRVQQFKDKCTSWDRAMNPGGLDALYQFKTKHRQLSAEAYRSSISLVRDRVHSLPFLLNLHPKSEILLLTPLLDLFPSTATKTRSLPLGQRVEAQCSNGLSAGETIFQSFGSSLAKERKGHITHASYSSNGLRPSHEQLISRASAVILVTADAVRNKYQYSVARYVHTLSKYHEEKGRNRKPVIVVAVSSPYDFLVDGDIDTYICTYDFTSLALDCLVEVLVGRLNPTGTPPLTVARELKLQMSSAGGKFANQAWLVEEYVPSRDSRALQRLLDEIPKLQSDDHLEATKYILQNDLLEGRHFAVRNSSTRALYGFCATYFLKTIAVAYISALMVHPDRRRAGIGGALHAHALNYLSMRGDVRKVELGSLSPTPFLGFLLGEEAADRGAADRWLLRSGWIAQMNDQTYTMSLQSLSTWVAPQDIKQKLGSKQIVFELLPSHSSVLVDSVRRFVKLANEPWPSVILEQVYETALTDAEQCNVLVASDLQSQVILGSAVIHWKDSALSAIFPLRNNEHASWVGALVLDSELAATDQKETDLITQGIFCVAAAHLQSRALRSLTAEGLSHEQARSLSQVGFQLTKSYRKVVREVA